MTDIFDRIEYLRGSIEDFLGFEKEVIAEFLTKEELKRKGFKEEDLTDWVDEQLTRENVIAKMKEYMPFALMKARDQRGNSALRSISKMKGWLWLLEDEEILSFANDNRNYSPYGSPILSKICEKYGFPKEELKKSK